MMTIGAVIDQPQGLWGGHRHPGRRRALTEAFAIATQCRGWPRYSPREILRELAVAGGSRQLIAGQVADLEGEGKKISAAQLKYIHERKTAALLICCVRLGGMSATVRARNSRRWVSLAGRWPGLSNH